MTIYVDEGLPAKQLLFGDGYPVSTESAPENAVHIGLVNLMSNIYATELDILRALAQGNTQDVKISLFTPENLPVKTDPSPDELEKQAHREQFYNPLRSIKDQPLNGLIITGRNVGKIAFEDVTFWNELTDTLDYGRENINTTLNLCWAAHADLYHRYGIPKHYNEEKLSGVFKQAVIKPNARIIKGISDSFDLCVSRFGYCDEQSLLDNTELEVLTTSNRTGSSIVQSKDGRSVYVTGHLEYSAGTLRGEYNRDMEAHEKARENGKITRIPRVPENYLPNDDINQVPENTWKETRVQFFQNWIDIAAKPVTQPKEIYEQQSYTLQGA